ncbi:MAG: hypothetical protein ACSHYF_14790 [Verrucomicrobiaceae bacterium]
MIILRTPDLALLAGILTLVFALQKEDPVPRAEPLPVHPASWSDPQPEPIPQIEEESPLTPWF